MGIDGYHGKDYNHSNDGDSNSDYPADFTAGGFVFGELFLDRGAVHGEHPS